MRILLSLSVFYVILIFSSVAQCDVIVHRDGQLIKGKILQKTQEGVLIQLDYGTFTYPHPLIKQIHEEKETGTSVRLERSSGELRSWRQAILSLSTQTWAHAAKQIPATVIDKGVLRNVPYISFRCGIDYEVNVYGDPDSPAGIEIGTYRSLLKNSAAKNNCVEFIAGLLPTDAEREILRRMDREKSAFTQDGITFEITPPTAEDAYGGWWVSIYNEEKLDKARASDAELKLVSVPRIQSSKEPAADSGWSKQELQLARPPTQAPPPRVAYSSPTPSYSSSRVYVRAYYRKDGTYVRGHTRRR